MDALEIKVALRILDHAGIPTCLVGVVALNYYNVPRVLHVSVKQPGINTFYPLIILRTLKYAYQKRR
jgi:hypothetical protein